MASLAEQGIVPFELVVVNLYPFAADDRPRGRDDRRSDRADRHRRADAGPRGGEEPCVRDDRVRAGAVWADSGAVPRERGDDAGAAAGAGGRGVCAHREVRHGDWGVLCQIECRSRKRRAASFRRKSTLRCGGRRRCGTARIRTRRRRSMRSADAAPNSLVRAKQLHGKELSYNNLLDLDSALAIARSLPVPGVAVLKHNNPCGAATAATLAEAMRAGVGRRSGERVRLGARLQRAGRRGERRVPRRAGPVRRSDRRAAISRPRRSRFSPRSRSGRRTCGCSTVGAIEPGRGEQRVAADQRRHALPDGRRSARR